MLCVLSCRIRPRLTEGKTLHFQLLSILPNIASNDRDGQTGIACLYISLWSRIDMSFLGCVCSYEKRNGLFG